MEQERKVVSCTPFSSDETGAQEQPNAVAIGSNIYLTYVKCARRKLWKIGGWLFKAPDVLDTVNSSRHLQFFPIRSNQPAAIRPHRLLFMSQYQVA